MGAEVRETAAPSPSDAAVIERAKRGDHEAFGVLVERYQGRAYGLALRVLRNEEQARDAVQDAFLKVYGSLKKFEGRSGFYTWFYRLVMNVCLDMKRRDRSSRHVEWEEERAVEIAQGAESLAPGSGDPSRGGPAAALERSELRELMARAIEALPDAARRTLELREIDGLSYAEIAEALGVPKGTVMSRLFHARRRVQAALIEAGVVDATPGGDAAEEAG
ncbi:MAG TPA: sigma-70 family RNA polymerase sigma factor [Myxococcota bacterium]|jgi:RNA polymerase sigma-70 factor (ECF subfamily)